MSTSEKVSQKVENGISRKRAYAELHLAVLLFGFTAILGRLISLEETVLVWWRMMLTTFSLLLIPGLLLAAWKIPLKNKLILCSIGVIVALHWVTFFGSIKASSVSVTLSCFGSTALFTALLEPLILGKRLNVRELGIGLAIIPGIYMVHYFTEIYYTGIILGLISALLAAIFSTLNKRQLEKWKPLQVTLYELGSGWLFLCVVLPFWLAANPEISLKPQTMDWLWLAILAFGCTTLAYVLSLRALQRLTAFASNLTINLEPVYGILLAMLIFQEHRSLNVGFYVGVGIILSAVFIHPFVVKSD